MLFLNSNHVLFAIDLWKSRNKREEIQSDFVAITKLDVAMNSILVRSKYFGLISISCMYIASSATYWFSITPIDLHPVYRPYMPRSVKAAAPSAPSSAVGSEGKGTNPKAKAKSRAAKSRAKKTANWFWFQLSSGFCLVCTIWCHTSLGQIHERIIQCAWPQVCFIDANCSFVNHL